MGLPVLPIGQGQNLANTVNDGNHPDILRIEQLIKKYKFGNIDLMSLLKQVFELSNQIIYYRCHLNKYD